jgi:hypothetical protein
MKLKKIFSKESFLVTFLFLFSLIINQFYANKGVFPVDSFSHFDTGFRILLGEHPFRDYWIISGPFVDYLQALIFYLFGTNWQVYILHASSINAILTISTYLVLRNFKLNYIYSFLYALFFSILAYPTSGTPFVDHHSVFFSLIGIYVLILAIKTEKKYYWLLLPFFLGFAFLSKQVPSSYIILFITFILFFYAITSKKYICIQYTFISTIIFIFLLLGFGKTQGITLASFLEQYIFYPQTIGEKRFSSLNFTFNNLIAHFKFIYISLAPLIYINVKNIFLEKKYFKNKDFIYFLIIVFLTISLIFHQLLTRNQTFIFFLIPLLASFSHIYIKPNKKFIPIIFLLFVMFVTTKYHIRFNENRKFHELNYSNFNILENAKKIDIIFAGLKWITPEFKENPSKEINQINDVKFHLKNDKNKKMLMTNYSFFSAMLNEKLFSTTRWHIFDGTDYPQKNSKHFLSYKKLFLNTLKKNNIKIIYMISPVKKNNLYDYIEKSCFEEEKVTEILTSFRIKNCKEIDN